MERESPSGQDIIDTYAAELCQDDHHYLYWRNLHADGEDWRKNPWKPTVADSTGGRLLHDAGLAHGVRLGRVPRHGRRQEGRSHHPVLSFMHEADSTTGFQMLNDPE